MTLILMFTLFLLALPGGTQGIALFLAGLAATGLTQLFKGNMGGRWALTLSVFVSVVISLIASYISGDIHNWQELVKNSTSVIAVAQLAYQYITLKKQPSISYPG
jgi:uncharacterized membrane protein YjjP (DUF1212 family)